MDPGMALAVLASVTKEILSMIKANKQLEEQVRSDVQLL